MRTRVGRNDLCPCGSGKKYKLCCLGERQAESLALHRLRRIEGELIRELFRFADEVYGDDHFLEGWEEFTLWRVLEEDVEDVQEFTTTFPQWYLFRFEFDPNQPREEEVDWPPMPVALAYLERCGDRLDSDKRCFIETASRSPYSFYRVCAVDAGRRLTLCDVFTGVEYQVIDDETSNEVRAHGLLYTSVLPADEAAILIGCAPVLLSPYEELHLLDLRDRFEAARGGGRLGEEDLCNYDIELRSEYFDLVYGEADVDEVDFHDLDGERPAITSLHFELSCSPREAFEKLGSLAVGLSAQELLSRAVYDEGGELQLVSLPWLEGGQEAEGEGEREPRRNEEGEEADQHVDEASYLGFVTIDGPELVAEVTSAERAERVRDEIEARLGEAVRFERSEVDSFDECLEDLSLEMDFDDGSAEGLSREGVHVELSEGADGAGELREDSLDEWLGDEEEAWADADEDDWSEEAEDVWDEVDWGDEDESRADATEEPQSEIVAPDTGRMRHPVRDSGGGTRHPNGRGGRVSRFPPGLHQVTPEMAEVFWQSWPDEKSPALHDRTPREAVNTPRGRERVEILLRSYEWAFESEPDVPFAPDLAALRRELGLLE